MNLDPRSATINTELGAVIDSPQLAREMLRIIDIDRLQSAYRVRRRPTARASNGSASTDDKEMVLTEEPDSSIWLRFKLILLAVRARVAAVDRLQARDGRATTFEVRGAGHCEWHAVGPSLGHRSTGEGSFLPIKCGVPDRECRIQSSSSIWFQSTPAPPRSPRALTIVPTLMAA